MLIERLRGEYGVAAVLEAQPYKVCRWVEGPPAAREWMRKRSDYLMVEDRDGRPVVLAQTPWTLTYALNEVKGLVRKDVSPV